MNKQQAIAAANKAGARTNYPKAESIYVTTDEKIFEKASLAVAHATTLSPGNPTVIELKAEELEEGAPAKSQEQLDAEAKAEALQAAKDKVQSLKDQLAKRKNLDDIDEDNAAEKLAVAQLTEELEAAEEELENLK